ncbi:MAG: hypothetical protein IKO93_07550 [Lentisphaeria bacterium]|nr:hypothetical protein [Lentisphaeria bacterium]
MITGELRNKIDGIWDTIWTGGITSPITVLEQITYLLFMNLLDDNQFFAPESGRCTLAERKTPSRISSRDSRERSHHRRCRCRNMVHSCGIESAATTTATGSNRS